MTSCTLKNTTQDREVSSKLDLLSSELDLLPSLDRVLTENLTVSLLVNKFLPRMDSKLPTFKSEVSVH
jgi:hypothetical protein